MNRKTFLKLLLMGSVSPFINIEGIKGEKSAPIKRPVPVKYYEYEYMGNKIRFVHNELLDGPLNNSKIKYETRKF